MHLRTFPAVGIGVAALILSTTFAGTATAADPDGVSGLSAVHKSTASSSSAPGIELKKGDCFSSLKEPDGLNGIASQDLYDEAAVASGADDFECNSDKKKNRKVKKVKALGVYYNGSGPADSFNVTVHNNDGGEPADDDVKCSFPEQAYTVEGDPGTVQTFTIKVEGEKCALKKGKTYWLEIQAVMAFATGGQWGWEVTTTQHENPADWKENGAFGTACTEYQNGLTMEDCIFGGASGVPDFMFSVT